ncbi:hypothetical protein GCM10009546_57630 [Actinomadura livida]|uniref:Uncharacterized protein n=1 Tax=Actinomadura livida TaxID=79909 RepID=A0ABP3QBN9_9ACTN|nr:hypothetical protein GCM10010208_63860 [Actinomadura livida]
MCWLRFAGKTRRPDRTMRTEDLTVCDRARDTRPAPAPHAGANARRAILNSRQLMG